MLFRIDKLLRSFSVTTTTAVAVRQLLLLLAAVFLWLPTSSSIRQVHAAASSESSPSPTLEDYLGDIVTMDQHPQQQVQEHQEASSSAASTPRTQTTTTTPTTTTTTTVRFWWIRHGETIANRDGLVVGQWDSPLSTLGQAQARALGQHQFLKTTVWKRRYASDLGRTQETIRWIIMGEEEEEEKKNENQDDSVDGVRLPPPPPPLVRLDARIREIAKGARQEFPKSWEYDRALEERRKLGMDLDIKLETVSEAWDRIADFVTSILAEVYIDESLETHEWSQSTQSSQIPQPPKNIMVVSHAGVIRTLLSNVASQAHPSLLRQGDGNDDGDHNDDPRRPPPPRSTLDDHSATRLQVPNTSVTILDVTMTPAFVKALQETTIRNEKKEGRPEEILRNHHQVSMMEDLQPGKNFHDLWTTQVVEFLWIGHLQEGEEGKGGSDGGGNGHGVVVEVTSNDE